MASIPRSSGEQGQRAGRHRAHPFGLASRAGLLGAAGALAVLGPFATDASAASGYHERLTVDASAPGGALSSAWLAAGSTYQISVNGAFSYGDNQQIADAECSTTDGLTWSRDRYGATALHLLVNSTPVEWTPETNLLGCDSMNHRYSVSYTPTRDGPASLVIAAGPGERRTYRGSLQVEIAGAGVATPPPSESAPAAPPETLTVPAQTPAPPAARNAQRTPAAPSAAPTATQQQSPSSAGSTASTAGAASAGSTGSNPLADLMLADQPRLAARPEDQVVLKAAEPRGNVPGAPSLLWLLALLLGSAAVLRPRQTFRLAADMAHRLPSSARPSRSSTPWRSEVERVRSAAPPAARSASELERPLLAGPAGRPAVTAIRRGSSR